MWEKDMSCEKNVLCKTVQKRRRMICHIEWEKVTLPGENDKMWLKRFLA